MLSLKTAVNLLLAAALVIGGGIAFDASVSPDTGVDINGAITDVSVSAGAEADTNTSTQAELDPLQVNPSANIDASVTADAALVGADIEGEVNVSLDADVNAVPGSHTSESAGPVSGLLNLITGSEDND